MTSIQQQAVNDFFSSETALSDIDYAYNPVSGKWDVPSVEWEYPSGYRFWETYASEDARSKALNEYDAHMREWVSDRIKAIKDRKRKRKEAYQKSLNTLGNIFPEAFAKLRTS
jgi:hypothetical protein